MVDAKLLTPEETKKLDAREIKSWELPKDAECVGYEMGAWGDYTYFRLSDGSYRYTYFSIGD